MGSLMDWRSRSFDLVWLKIKDYWELAVSCWSRLLYILSSPFLFPPLLLTFRFLIGGRGCIARYSIV